MTRLGSLHTLHKEYLICPWTSGHVKVMLGSFCVLEDFPKVRLSKHYLISSNVVGLFQCNFFLHVLCGARQHILFLKIFKMLQ